MTLPIVGHKLVGVKHSMNFREAVEIQKFSITDLAPDELLIKNYATGVNAADYLMAAGRYLSATPVPFDLGGETIGKVVAIGTDIDTFSVDDSVFTLLGGGFCDYYTVKARHAIPIPGLSAELVSLGVSGLTASIAFEEVARLKSGETVLVTAAAGGTGSFAVQLAKLMGCHVIGTCGSDSKVELLQTLGCDRPINYHVENLEDVLKAEYPKGVDVVFDGVGGEMFDTAVKYLAIKGRLLVIGSIAEYKSGPQKVDQIRIGYKLMNKSASIHGFWLMTYFREFGKSHMLKLAQLLSEGKLVAALDPTEFYGLEGAIDAVEYLYTGQSEGKVVVRYP